MLSSSHFVSLAGHHPIQSCQGLFLFTQPLWAVAKELWMRIFHSEDLLPLCETSCVLIDEIYVALPFETL